jgi:hypothetical protein
MCTKILRFIFNGKKKPANARKHEAELPRVKQYPIFEHEKPEFWKNIKDDENGFAVLPFGRNEMSVNGYNLTKSLIFALRKLNVDGNGASREEVETITKELIRIKNIFKYIPACKN